MKTYEIKSLDNGAILSSMEADGFTVDEHGIVLFYKKSQFEAGQSKTYVGATQISASVLLFEKVTPIPGLVVPFPEASCQNQS